MNLYFVGCAIILSRAFASFPVPTSLPEHSWLTVGHKVFIHGCKAQGPLTKSEIALAARFPILTVEKGQGFQMEGYAEDKMAAVSRQYKEARPSGKSIFYMNSIFDWNFYRMHETVLANAEFALHNPLTGSACHKFGDSTFPQPTEGMLVFNLSNPAMRKMFVEECVNATRVGFDGCFVDGADVWSQCAQDPSLPQCWRNGWFAPCNLTSSDFNALAAGQEALLQELQAAVTTDGIIVPKDGTPFDDTRFVDAMFPSDTFCSTYRGAWNEKTADTCRTHMRVNNETAARGQIGFMHGEFNNDPDAPSNQEQFLFTLAAFLVSAGDTSFFAYSDGWYYNGTTWHREYDFPLGAPKGLAKMDSAGIWHREFEAGVSVSLDVSAHKASIHWNSSVILV